MFGYLARTIICHEPIRSQQKINRKTAVTQVLSLNLNTTVPIDMRKFPVLASAAAAGQQEMMPPSSPHFIVCVVYVRIVGLRRMTLKIIEHRH